MTKKQLRALSRAETEILALLWGLGKGAVQDVCDILPPKRQIAYATVQTLLRRLESKGYVTHEVKGKAYVFRPSIKREEVIKRTVGDFVDRLFGGDPVPLLLHLANHSGLNPADVKRLKKLLEREES